MEGVVHNSMAHNPRNKYRLRKGQMVRFKDKNPVRTVSITHVTMAGEVIFDDGSWKYDYEIDEAIKAGNAAVAKHRPKKVW